MKNLITAFTLLFLLCSFKGDVPVNPEFFGTWRCLVPLNDKQVTEYLLIIKQNTKSDKFDVYRKLDPDGKPFYSAKMEDATHFKAKKHEDISSTIEAVHTISGYWEEKKMNFFDHIEQTQILGNNRKTGTTEIKRIYLKWDTEKKKYIDFPTFSRNAATSECR